MKFVALSFVVAVFSSFDIVDAAYEYIVEVNCEGDLPQDICAGETTIISPSPTCKVCDQEHDPNDPFSDGCRFIYQGGYSWEYGFVEGLEEGLDDYKTIVDAVELRVKIEYEYDATTCKIMVGNTKFEECNSCTSCATSEPEGCNDDGCCERTGMPFAFTYDCSNLKLPDLGKKWRGNKQDTCSATVDVPFYPIEKKPKKKPTKKPKPCKDKKNVKFQKDRNKKCAWAKENGRCKKKNVWKKCRKTCEKC